MEEGSCSNDEDSSFNAFGPKNINPNSINWKDDEYQRIVTACLVQSVYIETKYPHPDSTKSKPWYDSFHFEQDQKLMYEKRLYGVVFKFNHSKARRVGHQNLDESPTYVVAFRGTNDLHDMLHDLRLVFERLSHSIRISDAIHVVHKLLHKNKEDSTIGEKIWLAGHSLGSSIATFVGLKMAEDDICILKTFLFNPPFADHSLYRRIPEAILEGKPLIGKIDEIARSDIVKFVKKESKECAAKALKKIGIMKEVENTKEEYKNVHKWIPHLFINPRDFICNGFIDHFEKEMNLEDARPGNIMTMRTENNRKLAIPRIPWKVDQYSTHLLPSGRLIKHTRKVGEDIISYHKISQWWRTDLTLESQLYIKDI